MYSMITGFVLCFDDRHIVAGTNNVIFLWEEEEWYMSDTW